MPSSAPLQSWAKEELLRQNEIVLISGGKGKFGFQISEAQFLCFGG